MVPLVFKSSLGVVRLPEGSTPSLLRQIAKRMALREVSSKQLAVCSKELVENSGASVKC